MIEHIVDYIQLLEIEHIVDYIQLLKGDKLLHGIVDCSFTYQFYGKVVSFDCSFTFLSYGKVLMVSGLFMAR